MTTPVVAIVGAPNVGKSTLFNRLLGQRRAIVSDRPGVTRDRIAARCDIDGRQVTLLDTGGVVPGKTDDLSRQVRNEALKAMQEADLILFVVDARAGPTATDLDVATVLRTSGKPVIPIANKIDAPSREGLQGEVYRLGLGEVTPLSAEHGRGIDALEARIGPLLPVSSATPATGGVPVALLGRPNVGKSSLFNRIVRGDRALVSPTPGTTRDPIDAMFRHAGTDYRIVDTAGIRRHARTGEDIERVSVIKARQTLERSELAIALVDGNEEITHQDQALLGLVVQSRKPALLAVNKIDLLPRKPAARAERIASIRDALRFSAHVPIVPLSALTGEGIEKLLAALGRLRRQTQRRFSTAILNAALAAIVKEKHPPSDGGRAVRFFYMTQIGGPPPHFVIFGNGRRVGAPYRRFLERRLRTRLGITTTPLHLRLRQRPRSR
jgi:GTP-binding protein